MVAYRLKRDMVMSLCFTVFNVFAMMWMIRLAGTAFPPLVLGLFLLARRISSVGANLLQLGMPQTLLRYISLHFTDLEKKHFYVVVALVIWLGLVVLLTPMFYVTDTILAALAFPLAEDHTTLAFWVCGLALNTVLSFLIYATLLAERRVIRAYLIEFMNVSGFLLLAFLWWGKEATPVSVLRFQAIGMVILSFSMLSLYLREPARGLVPRWDVGREIFWVFISYGLPRTLIPFLDMLILLIGPWLLRARLHEAGFLVIALTLIQIIQAGIAPIMQIVSVAAARLIGAGDHASVSTGVRLLFGTVMYATVLTMALLIPWSEHLLRLWLQDPQLVEGVSHYFAFLLWGIPPIAVFHSLKGIIDMHWVRPFNLYTLALGAGLQVGLHALLTPLVGSSTAVCVSILVAYWGMGILTLIWIGSTYLRPLRYWGLGRLTIVALIVVSLNVWLERGLGGLGLPIASTLSIAIIILCLVVFAPAPIVRAIRVAIYERPQLYLKASV